MKNAFTVDFEDWYQSLGLPMERWDEYESRIHIGHEKLLTLLQKHRVKASYYIVGDVIDRHPDIIKEIIDEGHEIGCHTYTHRAIYDMSPEELDNELKKSNQALKKISSIDFTGFRAPMWSIDENSWWALDVVKKNQYQYDTSIYPGDNKRTGIEGYPKRMHKLDNNLTEIPCCTFPFLRWTVGVGGAYFRILPYTVTRRALRRLNTAGENGMFYVHPWELDPEHPRVQGLSRRLRYPHYYNLKNTENRIDRLLSDFEFCTLQEIIAENGL